MLRVFKNIRINMFRENSFSKYIIYAIGEVLLVVVGILIALQINNWNEKRKSQQELNAILKTISYDLATDTTIVSQIISYYEEHQKTSLKIINKEITKDNYKNCKFCGVLITSYQPFPMQKRGFELLSSFSNNHSNQKDSLVIEISQFYPIFIQAIEKSNDRLENVALKNLDHITQYSWFTEMMRGVINDEMISYFTESEDYRKRVASFDILTSRNHLALLKQYKLNAVEILRLLRERFKEHEN